MTARRGRGRRPHWTVDCHVDGDTGTWALVDPEGATRATGTVTVRRTPQPDSARAEAQSVLDALDEVPAGHTLACDSLFLLKAVKGGRHAEMGGKAGEVAQRAAARDVRVVWRRRSDPGVRAAHRAALHAARKARNTR